MPSFTFVGDEPLPLRCSVMINDKARQAFAKVNTAATDSSQTKMVASSITTAAKPPVASREVQLRLYLQEPGPLGLTIKFGAQCCTVTKIVNQSSWFRVDDVIISCNGCRFDSLIRYEGGRMRWVNLLKSSGMKCFVIQRKGLGGNLVPLKDISNTQKLCATGSASLGTCKASGSASLDTSKNELLLAQVDLHWRSGKGCHQTPACKAAIRACLLEGISPAGISHHVIRGMKGEVQDMERVRVRQYANRIQASGNSAPAATTTTTIKATNVQDLLSLGIPFQQNGVVYKKGDKAKKRKLLSDKAASIYDKPNSYEGTQIEIENQAKLRSMDTAQTLGSACDTAVITPNNSMEEVETNTTSCDKD